MYSNRTLCIILSSIFFVPLFACNPLARIPHLAPRILQNQQHDSALLLQHLQTIFLEMPDIQHTLVTGSERFQHKPGFLALLKKIYGQSENPEAVKGHLFEIEKALLLDNAHTEQHIPFMVVGFGLIRKSPISYKEREFDIIVQKGQEVRYYECKNTNWNMSINSGKVQFLEQKEIAQDLGARYMVKTTYVVSSKQPIPDIWKEFFEQNEIITEESDAER